MVYHVGSPAMFDGNRFFPLTGTPIPKMLFSSTLLADCDPDPFTVATLMLKSLTMRWRALRFALFLTQGQVSSRHVAGFPSDKFESAGARSMLYVSCSRPKCDYSHFASRLTRVSVTPLSGATPLNLRM